MTRRVGQLLAATLFFGPPVSAAWADESITYVGVIRDQTDFEKLGIGKAGYWFPQFSAEEPVAGRPTGENARDALPTWAGPLNHATKIWDLAFWTRTFSQDGPGRSKGGQEKWNKFILPGGEAGSSGAIVDPFAFKNTNNSVNRIQLGESTPSLFFLHIVTDNTNKEHNPTNRLRARGNTNGVDLEPSSAPAKEELKFNGVADIYTFRYEGFDSGDFIKIQLNGDSKQGPSIGGMMFDTEFEPQSSSPLKSKYDP
ncbi:hypothetical protein [Bythopirellula polymerisocia]|uniref:Uncharacterized protein n=1 Tax=Bythopirellula polymerisocia TaxID=2528003 RepID=A0A5C6CV25_9BACT|nr:hypothetical protein [Bythopirellula polymerisocia]TWU27514.1 hypothetical protein Pla144_22880 [Bythopirellula polymerisocia]